MGKTPEDKIREKLVELELSIKDEDSKQLPSAGTGTGSTSLSKANTSLSSRIESSQTTDTDLQLYKYGGIALSAISLFMILGHAGVTTSWLMMWGRGPSIGYMLFPLLIGVGMLFYNYKSRLAQAITVGSLALFIVALFSSLVITFPYMTLLDLIFMAAPLCAGIALIAKGYQKSHEIKGITKEPK